MHTPRRARHARAAAGLLVAACAAAPALAAESAFPGGAQAQVQTVLNTNATVSPSPATQLITLVNPGTSVNSGFVGANGNANAQVDLSTGLLRADAQGTSGYSSFATGWEFVSFSGNGNISFALAVDGTLRNLQLSGMAIAQASVNLYDVTSWASYFASSGGQQYVAKDGSGSPFPDRVGFAFDNAGVRGATAASCASQFINTCTTNSSGAVVPVTMALAGSAPVLAGHVYLLEMNLSLYTFNSALSTQLQAADFSHTAAFSFSNLNGLSVTSSSGTFLSAVPEPASLALMLAGVAALAGLRRHRR
jgi:hypothetical protein